MNFPEIENAVIHLKKASRCLHCQGKYNYADINLIASTSNEGLFEMKCQKCHNNTLVTVLLGAEPKIDNKKDSAQHLDLATIKEKSLRRTHRKIEDNDVLDIKNFLNNFDGNFKKIFTRKK